MSRADRRFSLLGIVPFQLLALPQNDSMDPIMDITLFVCLSQLVLAYSICTASFPIFQRFASELVTYSGNVTATNHRVPTEWDPRTSRQICAWDSSRELDTLPFNDKAMKETDTVSRAETTATRDSQFTRLGRPGSSSLSSITPTDLMRDGSVSGHGIRDIV